MLDVPQPKLKTGADGGRKVAVEATVESSAFEKLLTQAIKDWMAERLASDAQEPCRQTELPVIERFEAVVWNLLDDERPFDRSLTAFRTTAELTLFLELAIRVSSDLLRPATDRVLAHVAMQELAAPTRLSPHPEDAPVDALLGRLNPLVRSLIAELGQ